MNLVSDVTRDELLRALQLDWGVYLPVLKALPARQQRVYARQEGFKNLRDFLLHVAAWWGKAIEAAAIYQYGSVFPPHPESDDEFNARILDRYRNWTLDEAEDYFKITWLGICGMVNDLPDRCFENLRVNRWLYETIILHFEQHESPAAFRKRLTSNE